MCDRIVIKLPGNPGELKIIYICKMLKENTSLDHGHLQVHNELKPSNRVVNIYLYSLSLTFVTIVIIVQYRFLWTSVYMLIVIVHLYACVSIIIESGWCVNWSSCEPRVVCFRTSTKGNTGSWTTVEVLPRLATG